MRRVWLELVAIRNDCRQIAEDERKASAPVVNIREAEDAFGGAIEMQLPVASPVRVMLDGRLDTSSAYPYHQAHYWSIKVLAEVYADRPGYREEWEP